MTIFVLIELVIVLQDYQPEGGFHIARNWLLSWYSGKQIEQLMKVMFRYKLEKNVCSLPLSASAVKESLKGFTVFARSSTGGRDFSFARCLTEVQL